MAKRMRFMLIALGIVFGAIFGWGLLRQYFMAQYFASMGNQATTISTSYAQQETWEPFLNTAGTVHAVNGVDISSEASGIVEGIYFNSGQLVRKGNLLVRLSDRVEQADLISEKAALSLAEINYKRMEELFKRHAIANSAFDEASAKRTQAQASVARTQALIAQKNVVAPFDGKLGIRAINIGQYVPPGSKFVNLQSLAPLYIDFSLPEQNLKHLYVGQPVQVAVNAYPTQLFVGKINAINSTADPKTHNISIQALLPNQDLKLYPGLFADIKVWLAQKNNVISVPQTAVAYSLFGNSVFVVKQDGKDDDGKPILKAERRYVTTGDERNNKVAILKGIKAGEMVVISGQLKLESGARVKINNSVNLALLNK